MVRAKFSRIGNRLIPTGGRETGIMGKHDQKVSDRGRLVRIGTQEK